MVFDDHEVLLGTLEIEDKDGAPEVLHILFDVADCRYELAEEDAR
jgi:hypothetical protein